MTKVGTDYTGIVVCALVHDGKGNILLLKRGNGARDEHGAWDICGGALDFGEAIEDGLRREIKEELATEPEQIKFMRPLSVVRKQNGAKTHWLALCHAVRVKPSTVTLAEPHKFDELGWFSTGSLPNPLHSQFHKILAMAKQAKIV